MRSLFWFAFNWSAVSWLLGLLWSLTLSSILSSLWLSLDWLLALNWLLGLWGFALSSEDWFWFRVLWVNLRWVCLPRDLGGNVLGSGEEWGSWGSWLQTTSMLDQVSFSIELWLVILTVSVVFILDLVWVVFHPSLLDFSVFRWVGWVPVGIVVVILGVNVLVVVDMVLLTGVWSVVGI